MQPWSERSQWEGFTVWMGHPVDKSVTHLGADLEDVAGDEELLLGAVGVLRGQEAGPAARLGQVHLEFKIFSKYTNQSRLFFSPP